MNRVYVVVSVLLFAGCGVSVPLLSGSASDSQVCEDSEPQSIEGVPTGTVENVESAQNLDLSALVGQLLGSGSMSSKISLTSFTVTATQGVEDLGFIDSTTVSVQADGGVTDLVHYARPDGGTVGSSITAAPLENVNLLSVASGGHVELDLHFVGTLPKSEWKASLRPCFAATVDVSLKP